VRLPRRQTLDDVPPVPVLDRPLRGRTGRVRGRSEGGRRAFRRSSGYAVEAAASRVGAPGSGPSRGRPAVRLGVGEGLSLSAGSSRSLLALQKTLRPPKPVAPVISPIRWTSAMARGGRRSKAGHRPVRTPCPAEQVFLPRCAEPRAPGADFHRQRQRWTERGTEGTPAEPGWVFASFWGRLSSSTCGFAASRHRCRLPSSLLLLLKHKVRCHKLRRPPPRRRAGVVGRHVPAARPISTSLPFQRERRVRCRWRE